MSTNKSLAKQTLRLFWQYAWHYKLNVTALIVFTPLAILFFQFLPQLIVARVLERIGKNDFVKDDLWGSFGSDILWYAGISFIGGVILWRVVIYFLWKLEMNVTRDIHQHIFNHLLSLSADFHANRFGGSLVSQTNKFVGAYVRIVDTTLFQIYGLVIAFVTSAVILIPRAPLIVLGLSIFSVLFVIASILITKRLRELTAVEATVSNKQTGFLADAITNVLAVKSFASKNQENERYAKATENSRQATHNTMVASLKRDSVFAVMTNILNSGSLLLAVAGVVIFDADIATVFLVVSFTANVSQRLWDFSQSTLRNYNRALGDAHDMTEILAIAPGVKDAKNTEASQIKNGQISFEKVNFTHADSGSENTLFKHFSLDIKPGEKIGLVGHSGSGKTSLTKLLLRFYDVDGGEILIDGQNIARIAQEDLRRQIAYVPQEPLLFHRSIEENIAYGQPGATTSDIVEAAKKANAEEFIVKLPHGYDTLVGERGVKLSGGQKQRVAIARAILKDAPILVLDEATSALDSESELLIQAALRELMKGRTAIVIAHRLSTVQKMDRILVLENGKIVEQGSHQELLAKNGKYAQLWSHQSGGFIEE